MMNLKHKTVLITGATQGLGRAVALLFAEQGANLILTGRNFAALETVDDEIKHYKVQTTLVQLDLNEFDKVSQLGGALSERYPHIDIFIANAATLGTLSPLTHQNFDIWQQTFSVNVHANWLLLQTLEPLLTASACPQIIGITTGLLTSHLPYWGAYAVSKAAFQHMILMYAQEKKSLGFKVNCLDPGIMRTKIFETAMPGSNLTNVPDPLIAAQAIIKMCLNDDIKTGQVLKTTEV